ncbi:MAG: hypothetical protein NTX12_05970 [Actinobacteria bacterium]|nr:hypothetical protein [Actinomycetota bacterium]
MDLPPQGRLKKLFQEGRFELELKVKDFLEAKIEEKLRSPRQSRQATDVRLNAVDASVVLSHFRPVDP